MGIMAVLVTAVLIGISSFYNSLILSEEKGGIQPTSSNVELVLLASPIPQPPPIGTLLAYDPPIRINCSPDPRCHITKAEKYFDKDGKKLWIFYYEEKNIYPTYALLISRLRLDKGWVNNHRANDRSKIFDEYFPGENGIKHLFERYPFLSGLVEQVVPLDWTRDDLDLNKAPD